MKEFCGYKASDNSLWETKEECEKHEINLKIKSVLLKIAVLESNIRNYVDNNYRQKMISNRGIVTENQAEEIIKNSIVSILTDGKPFILQLYEKGNIYKKELDELESKLENTNKPWYLKMKWWN